MTLFWIYAVGAIAIVAWAVASSWGSGDDDIEFLAFTIGIALIWLAALVALVIGLIVWLLLRWNRARRRRRRARSRKLAVAGG